MAEIIHPFYESHRGAMEAAMRHRLDLAEAMSSARAHIPHIDRIRQEVMDEFKIVLTQMPYVGGAASRMSDFFMRLIGFMAISRVLRRHGVPLAVIGEIERETYKAQLLTVPEADRLASGRQFMSRKIRLSCASSDRKAFRKSSRKISSTISSSRARVTTLNSASTTRLAAFANSRLAMETRKSCRTFAGLISTPTQRKASTWKERKRWPAARATAISGSRGLRRMQRRRARPPSHALRLRVRPDCPCCHLVIASAAKQSRIFPRRQSGLLRCARNDGGWGAVRSRSAHTAMMTSCSCFARRVKRRCGRSSRNFGFW